MPTFSFTFDEKIISNFKNFTTQTKQDIIDFFKPMIEDTFGGYPTCFICIEEVVSYNVFSDQVLLFEINYFDDGVEPRVEIDLIGFVHHNDSK